MNKKNPLGLKLFLSLLHGIFMVCITILLQYTGNLRFDEVGFFKAFAITKHSILGIDKKPVGDSIVCLDVSKDQVMVADTGMNYGKIHITDRAILTKFFDVLNKHPGDYKAVLCDVAFTIPSPKDDTAFKLQFENARDVYTFLTMNDDKPGKPLFKGKYGAADYTVIGSDFVKYPLFYNDSLQSLPVCMVQGKGKSYTHDHLLTYENGHLSVNTFIPEFYYRTKDLDSTKSGANFFHIGEVVNRPDFFKTCIKNKYILIGDFYNDKHSTYFGSIPGTLIVFDAFLTLRDNRLAISWIWVILLVCVFSAVSFYVFYTPESKAGTITETIKVSFVKEFLQKYISFLGLLIGLNIISYLFFGVFISLFYLATYLTVIRMVIKRIIKLKKGKNLMTILIDSE